MVFHVCKLVQKHSTLVMHVNFVFIFVFIFLDFCCCYCCCWHDNTIHWHTIKTTLHTSILGRGAGEIWRGPSKKIWHQRGWGSLKIITFEGPSFLRLFCRQCEIGVKWASVNSLTWSIGRSLLPSFLPWVL